MGISGTVGFIVRDELIVKQEVLSDLLEHAVKAATAPAEAILRYFHSPNLSVQSKQDGSPVTMADQEAEQIIRDMLGSDSPIGRIDILGEEQGLHGSGTSLRWTIDPIDGTRSFVQGIPLFGTIVALEDTINQRALLGVIHLPMLNMTYRAARGIGSWCNHAPLRVSTATRPEEAIVAVGDPLQFSNGNLRDAYRRLYELCPCLRGYTDCFGHALVASGAVAAMIDPTLNPWDVMAAQVLVEEGGGSLLMRPSAEEGKVDALFGNSELVNFLSTEIQFMK